MKEFNVVVTGVGGQGVLTLAHLIAKCCLAHNLNVIGAEQHGLAQRGGHIEAHVRIGKVYSPLVMQGNADLIISLEPLEALRAAYYASEKTIFLVNSEKIIPISVFLEKQKYPTLDKIKNELKKFTKKIEIIDAGKIAKKIGNDIVYANIYLFAYAIKKGYLPFKKRIALKVLEEVVPPKYVEINRKIFEEAFKS